MAIDLEKYKLSGSAINLDNYKLPQEQPLIPVDEETSGFFDNIKKSFQSRTNTLSEGYLRQIQGKQTRGESALQSVGQTAGMVGDIVFQGISALIPQKIKDSLSETAKKAVDNPIGQQGMAAIGQGLGAYAKWKEANPRWADDLEATVNIATTFPVTKAAKVAGTAVGGVAKTGGKVVKQAAKPAVNKLQNKLVANLAKKYEEVGGSLVRQSKALGKAEAKGRNLPQILAERNIVPLVSEGKMHTTDVADNFLDDINPLNGHLDDALKELDPATPRTSWDEFEKAAIKRAKSQKNIEANTAGTIETQLKKEFAEYRQNYPNGLNLSEMNNIKQAKWGLKKKSFESNAPYLKNDSDYIIGKTAMDTIEKKVPKEAVDVHEFNNYVGQLYEAEKFLRSLDGHAVKGGKLGNYFAGSVGSMVGRSILKVPVLGEMAGYVAGDMVADILQKNTFSNGVKQLILRSVAKKDPAQFKQLMQFLKQSEAEQVTRLALPAPSFIAGQPWKGGVSGKIKTPGPGQSIIQKETPKPLTRLMLPAKGQTSQGSSSPILSVPKNKEYTGAQQAVGGFRGIQNTTKNDKIVDKVKKTKLEPKSVKAAVKDMNNPLIQEARKYKTAEEFVKAKERLSNELLKTQIVSDAGKYRGDLSNLSKETFNSFGNEYKKKLNELFIDDGFGNKKLPQYDNKAKYVEKAIDTAKKENIPVHIGVDKIKTAGADKNVPVVYFETKSGQVSFHMPDWYDKSQNIKKIVKGGNEYYGYPETIMFDADKGYKVNIPDRYHNLFDKNYKWNGKTDSRKIIEKEYKETKSQLTDIWNKANKKTAK